MKWEYNMKNDFKVQNFIKLIQSIEKLYVADLGRNSDLIQFLQKFLHFLEPHKRLSGNEFLKLFDSLKSKKQISNKKESILTDLKIEEITFLELREILESDALSKEELLEIGDKKFSISKGTNKKLNKDQLKELIESAMKNIETLRVIKNKAAE